MSDLRFPQNPGIGGIDELTSVEEAVVQATASLTGNASKLLRVKSDESGVEWVTWVPDETPTGTIDGTNTTFTLAHTPNPTTTLLIFLNGLKLRPTTDFSVSGTTLTMVKAPRTGAILRVEYFYLI